LPVAAAADILRLSSGTISRSAGSAALRLLLINPNTTAAVTESCARVARAAAAPGTEIVPLTGTFGANIVNTRTENAIAAHALLTVLAENLEGCDGVLLAVSYDTALLAAREFAGVPVVGMTEAAIVTAQLLGTRFGLVVFGTPVVYRELVAAHGFADRFAGLRSIDMAATAAFTTPEAVNDRVVEAAIRLAEDDGAECVVLCGAAMAGMARRLQSRVPVPLVDGIACGVPLLEMLVRMGVPAPTAGSLAPPTGRATTGLSPALARRLMGG
jgi:allantoin racemase